MEKKRRVEGRMEGEEGRRGEEETVIISSHSCESQPALQPLPGKLEMHTTVSPFIQSQCYLAASQQQAFLFCYNCI